MITLDIISDSPLDKTLLKMFKESKIYRYGTWSNWLKTLDYVQEAEYDDAYCITTLTFDTEQDKLFFLLKYS